jgi:hypothetical protein
MEPTPLKIPPADEFSIERLGEPERAQLLAATDLQDHLLVAINDLDRLHRLLSEAGEALISHFHAAADHLKLLRREVGPRSELPVGHLDQAMNHMAAAITSLQFQDLASQLLTHTGRRLRGCADRLAADAMDADDECETFLDTLPLSPNPVTQDEMDAGSVELF